jgi:hypothetical protein
LTGRPPPGGGDPLSGRVWRTVPSVPVTVAVEADGRRLRNVTDPRFFPTGHASPQPFLAPLAETAWHPAQRLAPYRPRRTRVGAERQAPLPEPDREPASG